MVSQLLDSLPQAVAERVRPARDGPTAGGEWVLYWMRTAVRGHENPALDAALALAEALDLPAFVYHGLSERYPFASDRHHTFILEGARALAAELEARGVGYAFHLTRPGHRGQHLVALARRAAAVVTEDMPIAPLSSWIRALGRQVERPVLRVDCACVVPMRLVARRHERAFAFRRDTESLRRERLRRPWHDREPSHPPFVPGDLPFAPIDLARADLPRLVAACEIDHAVAPVPHTRGGAPAGYRRWQTFRDGALERYHRDRNDPLRDGTSGLSPYLHFGFVSPLRIAREAAALRGDGARKFLDELLVWRELAYNLCFHEPAPGTPEALPEWARETLAAHRDDPRPALPSWETLARAKTGDALWDAAQDALRIHGWLHNNLRMTWGKALVPWTPDAGRAIALLEDLNHRYALDGRDPASYGGILWCLGLYDRPFTPEQPILGTVRPRPTAEHARRLDPARYRARRGGPALARPPRVAVIGGGPAGAICARTLADHGLEVMVLDKGRGAGGRLSTRRAGPFAFDHGAQYFTQRDPRLAPYVASWLDDGVIAPWPRGGKGRRPGDPDEERYVGVPGMSRLVRHLLRDLDVAFELRVESLERDGGRWHLRVGGARPDPFEPFDAVAVAVPAPQAVPLLAASPPLAERAAAVEMAPCWAAMAAFETPPFVDLAALDLTGTPLVWVARNDGKPGRAESRAAADAGVDCWVLHASPRWSARHLDDPEAEVAGALLAAFAEAADVELPASRHLAAHRWRFARVTKAVGEDCLFDPEAGLGACGDWCLGPRVEAALLSGVALAGRILAQAAARETRDTTQLDLFGGAAR